MLFENKFSKKLIEFCNLRGTMRYLNILFLLFTSSIFSQNPIDVKLIQKTDFSADTLVGVNNLNNIFYILDNVLFKKSDETKALDIGYTNFQLGNITSANAFNTLKINIFYKDFNTAIILDNRLSEIFRIEFNNIPPYKNVTHISTGNDNTIWIFDQNTQQLELYDYKNKSTKSKTLPIESAILDIKSNYNTCWLLTKDFIYIYNYFGSLTKKIPNTNFEQLQISNENIILKKGNELFYLAKDSETIKPIKSTNLIIKQFFVTGESLYIYSDKSLFEYQIKI